MTTHEALPHGDIEAWRVEDPEITGPLPRLAGVAPDWDWDWDWDQPAADADTATAAPSPVPWYARTSVLLALIGAAAAALVVATVLLMAPGDSEETPDKLRPVVRTTPPTTRVIVPKQTIDDGRF
ncbi:MAG: hypothetical protein EBU54_07065, partial [Mycobacteriaceae bacterium]|nr:hypothetical protein [Mycobacteriaceae bacterium]